MKLRNYLVLLVAAAAVPLAFFSAAALQRVRDSERAARHQAVLEATQSIVFQIDRDLVRAEAVLRALAASPSLAAEDWPALARQAAVAGTSPDTWTVVFGADGRQRVNTRLKPGEALPSGGAPDNLDALMRRGTPSVSGLFVGTNTGRQLMRVDVPTTLPDGRGYLLTIAFEASYFSDLIRGRALPDTWLVALFDQQGLTVARSHRAAEFVGKRGGAGILEAARDAQQGLVRTVTRDGIALYDTFVKVPRSGWIVANGVPAAELEGVSDESLSLFATGFSLAVALGALYALFLALRLTAAFRRVSQAIGLIGADDFPVLPASSVSDLAVLQANVVDAHQRLRRAHAARQAAESEREQLFALEQGHRRRAEEENRSKDHFLAMLGHELRNPLSAIMGAVALMVRRPGERDVVFAREMIGRQATHLTRIVDDLLEVSRVLQGKIVLRMAPLDWSDVVASAIAALRTADRLAQRHVTVDVHPVWVRGDRARLEQVVTNLLGNALKFTHPGGHVDVALHERDGQAVLTVRDDGEGMSASLIATAFDAFVQGPTAAEPAHGGLGIGLALVRQLVADHHGTVSAASDGEGRGATFTVTLPCVPPAPEMRVVDDAVEGPDTAAPGRRVLIVEDQLDVRDAMAMLIESEGHHVTTAASGGEALALLAEERFDVAIVDIGLPGIDGHEVARRIRAMPHGHQIRLVALTGYGQPRDVAAAAEAGFDRHMVKPVDPDRLLPLLHDLSAG